MTRPYPEPTADSDPFWAGCREGKLRMQRCDSCATMIWFPKRICQHCGSSDTTWIDLTGDGVLYSYSHVLRPASAAFPPSYVLALVDLDEGPRMMTHLVGGDEVMPQIGMRLHVQFEPLTETIMLPVFAAAGEA